MIELYQSVKDEFKILTQKSNYKIYNNKYFIPVFNIFRKRLVLAIKEYNLTDEEKIKEVLLRYVRECVTNKFPKFTRTVEYYIYGQDGKDCRLADDYENYEDILRKEEIDKLGIKKNKELFG